MAEQQGQPKGRIAQIRQTYSVTKRTYPHIGFQMAGIWLAVFAILLGIGYALNMPVILGILGAATGLLAVTYFFGRRAESAAYSQIKGQPGAAAAVLNTLRKGWFVTPAVAVTKNQDIVHRVVGRPGVILVGEGAPTRLPNLMATERKKVERWVPEVPVTLLIVGDEAGEVPLEKVSKRVMKLPKALQPGEVTEVRQRLDAAAKVGSQLPIPKGPMPKNARMPRPKQR